MSTYTKKPKVKLQSGRCACSRVATHKVSGTWVCDFCQRIESWNEKKTLGVYRENESVRTHYATQRRSHEELAFHMSDKAKKCAAIRNRWGEL